MPLLGGVEMLALGALISGESDFPALRIFKTHSVKMDKLHEDDPLRTAGYGRAFGPTTAA